MTDEIVFAPASIAQSQFLCSDADITFYGGELRLQPKPI
jgi:hypothetical protein